MLPVVRTIEAQMSTDPMLNHEYLPLEGMKLFTEGCTRLLLGDSSPAITHNRVSVSSYGEASMPRVGFLNSQVFSAPDLPYIQQQ